MSREDEWLEWRRGGITATEVADAANGTYGGAYGVVARKLGLIRVEQTAQMRRGHEWQPRIADAVHALTGRYVAGEEAWFQNSDDPMIRATIDGLLADTPAPESIDDVLGVVEVKTRGKGVRPNRQRWADQVQWQLLATGLPAGLLVEAVIDDVDESCDAIYLMEIERDSFRQDALLQVGKQLWEHYSNGTLPEPEASSLALVKEVNSDADPDADPVDLTELEHDIARLVQIKAATKLVEEERDAIEARIRHHVGEAEYGTSSLFKVTVSNPTNVVPDHVEREFVAAHPEWAKQVLDRDRIKAEAPELYESLRRPVGARRLTIKELEQ